MTASDGTMFLAALLSAAASIALVAFVIASLGQRRRAFRQRLRARRANGPVRTAHGVSPVANVAQLDQIGGAGDNGSLRRWLLKNGFEIAPRALAGRLAIGVAFAFLLGVIAGLGPVVSLVVAVVCVPGLTLMAGRQRIARRMAMAEQQFPAVIGTIVRTLRSGLTLQDAIQLVASEGPDPLRGEFARVLTDEAIGLPLPDACQRMATRLPFDSAEFFALIVAIQTETGGGIVTALENLAETTEARAALAEKIVVSGQEARASALIIGALPPLVLGMLWFVQPEFVSVLFVTLRGQIALAGAVLMVVVGSLVMREMAKFDG
jgi:tight adherence protein B